MDIVAVDRFQRERYRAGYAVNGGHAGMLQPEIGLAQERVLHQLGTRAFGNDLA